MKEKYLRLVLSLASFSSRSFEIVPCDCGKKNKKREFKRADGNCWKYLFLRARADPIPETQYHYQKKHTHNCNSARALFTLCVKRARRYKRAPCASIYFGKHQKILLIEPYKWLSLVSLYIYTGGSRVYIASHFPRVQ